MRRKKCDQPRPSKHQKIYEKKSPQWSDFELITKIGLEALGYTVVKDVLLAGSQIDLYAELKQELFVHRAIVECKDHSEEVGVETARQLFALVEAVSSKSQPTSGIIVSRCGFTKTARAFASNVNITLLELEQLLRLSFDPFSILPHILQSFERDELNQVYVDLSCTVHERGTGTVYRPVEQFFDTFFSTTKRSGVSVLGNFGSGKTSLCKHYAYLLAKRYNRNENNCLLPIYVNLRDVQNLLDLEREVLTLLQTEYGAKVNAQGWHYWLVHRPTLLLLDGFDEMASKMDKVEINRNIAHLSNFSSKYFVKILLTCRTHFFKTEVEEQALGTMLRLYLRDWGTTELVEYVSRSLPSKTESSLDTIRSTYNLEELARTPLFLNMIAATMGEVQGIVNQARLYQVYTDRWIQHQDYRSKLSPSEKELFMEELAFEMFTTGQSRIHYGGLPSKIKLLLSVQDYEALTTLDRDIRTCSFLIRDRDSDGDYHFAHKSYMEFFVAFKLAKEVKANKLDNFARRDLSIEIAGFFINYFEDELDIIIRNLVGHSDSIVRANCALALGWAKYNPDIFSALALSIKTDRDVNVRRRAVDAISRFRRREAVVELIRLSTDKGDFGYYCLKRLAAFMDYKDVLEMCREILRIPQNPERVRIVLENIVESNCLELSEELLLFAHTLWWENHWNVARALVTAIQATDNLALALMLETIEKNEITNYELSLHIQQAKYELMVRFRPDVDNDATKYKAKGMTRAKNEGTLRGKYKSLIDDAQLGKTLNYLYPIKKKQLHKRKRKG